MSYDAYKRELRADVETVIRAEIYYEGLYVRRPLKGVPRIARAPDEATYERGIEDGESHDGMVASAKLGLRVYTLALADSARISILDRLKSVERAYFRKVRRHRSLPIVSYDAVTERTIKELRGSLTSALTLPGREDDTVADIPDREWIRRLWNFQAALNQLKATAKDLSNQIASWEKAIDDKWRLNAALVGLTVTLAVFVYREIKDYAASKARHDPTPVVIHVTLR